MRLLPECFVESSRRLRAVALGLSIVLALGGCTSDSPTRAEGDSRLISQVGTVVEVHAFSDGTFIEYLFERVHFEGDILLSEYRQAFDLISGDISDGTFVVRVANYRVFPASALNGESEDSFQLFLCVSDVVPDCSTGVRSRFELEDGAVVNRGSGFW